MQDAGGSQQSYCCSHPRHSEPDQPGTRRRLGREHPKRILETQLAACGFSANTANAAGAPRVQLIWEGGSCGTSVADATMACDPDPRVVLHPLHHSLGAASSKTLLATIHCAVRPGRFAMLRRTTVRMFEDWVMAKTPSVTRSNILWLLGSDGKPDSLSR